MKKFLVFLLCFLLVSCSPKINLKEENYETISYGDVQQKIKDDESFVFYLGQKGCPDCEQYLKTLSKYFESHQDKKIYHLDYNENFADGMPYYGKGQELANVVYDVLGKDYFDFYGWEKGDLFTPTTFKVKQGEYVKVFVSSMSAEYLDDFFDFSSNNINVNQISYDVVKDNLENLKDSIFYLSQDGCPACAEFEHDLIAHSRLDSEVNIGKLDYKDIKDNSEAIKSLKGYVFTVTQDPLYLESLYTPTIFKIKDGTLKVYVGDVNETTLNEILG